MAAAAAAAALAWRACAPRPAPPFCQQRRALPPGTNYFLQRDFAVNLLYAGRGGAEAPARASGEARLPAAAARCLGALPWLRAGPRAAWRQVQGAVPWRAASHFGSVAARLSSAPGLAWAGSSLPMPRQARETWSCLSCWTSVPPGSEALVVLLVESCCHSHLRQERLLSTCRRRLSDFLFRRGQMRVSASVKLN